jgi:hypothetical protein
MGILAEVPGFALPGSSTIPTPDERALAAAEAARGDPLAAIAGAARP